MTPLGKYSIVASDCLIRPSANKPVNSASAVHSRWTVEGPPSAALLSIASTHGRLPSCYVHEEASRPRRVVFCGAPSYIPPMASSHYAPTVSVVDAPRAKHGVHGGALDMLARTAVGPSTLRTRMWRQLVATLPPPGCPATPQSHGALVARRNQSSTLHERSMVSMVALIFICTPLICSSFSRSRSIFAKTSCSGSKVHGQGYGAPRLS